MTKKSQRGTSWKVVGTGNFTGRGLASKKRRDLDIFVGGCDHSTSEEDIIQHCTDLGIEVKKVEELTTKSEWYKPFKVTVAGEDRDTLLKPESWHAGIFVRKFFNPRP